MKCPVTVFQIRCAEAAYRIESLVSCHSQAVLTVVSVRYFQHRNKSL